MLGRLRRWCQADVDLAEAVASVIAGERSPALLAAEQMT